jgi:hypothetical protein
MLAELALTAGLALSSRRDPKVDRGSLSPFGLRLARGPLTRFNSSAAVYEDRRADFVTSEVGLSYSASAILLAAALH